MAKEYQNIYVSYVRQTNKPLDSSSIIVQTGQMGDNDMSPVEKYAKNITGTSYPGQIISYIDELNSSVTIYKINTDRTITAIDTVPDIDKDEVLNIISEALKNGGYITSAEAEKLVTERLENYYNKDKIDNIVKDIIGSSESKSSDNSICGAKKYAEEITTEKAEDIIGTNEDTSSENTIYGAKKYTDEKVSALKKEIDENAVTLEVPDTDKYIKAVTGKTDNDGLKFTISSNAENIEAKVNTEVIDAISNLNAKVSGESNKVKVTVVEADGKLTSVEVEAPDFESIYTTKTEAQEETDRAIAKEKELEDYINSKISSVEGSDAIKVNTSDKATTVVLKINEEQGNVTLSQSDDGLKANITAEEISKIGVQGVIGDDNILSVEKGILSSTLELTYKSEDKKIFLFGKDSNKPISEIDASDFIKDGMLDSAKFDKNSNILTLTFNTDSGKEAIPIDLSSLVDTYKAGEGLVLANDGTFSIDTTKIATVEKVKEVSDAVDGLSSDISTLKVKDKELVAADEELQKNIDSVQTAVNNEIVDAKNRETEIFNRATAYTETKTNSILGTSEDTAEKATVYGAKKYTDAKVADLEDKIDANAITLEVPDTDKYISGISGNTDSGGIKFTISSNKTAITSAIEQAITTKIESLDAKASDEANGVKVTVEETDGKLIGVTVEAPDFANTYADKDSTQALIVDLTDQVNVQGEKIDTLDVGVKTIESNTIFNNEVEQSEFSLVTNENTVNISLNGFDGGIIAEI